MIALGDNPLARVFALQPWFSNSREHQNHLEVVLKKTDLEPHLQSFCFSGTGQGPENLLLNLPNQSCLESLL